MKFLDKINSQNGDVIILGSRPGVGKSQFLNYIIFQEIENSHIVYVTSQSKKSIFKKRLSTLVPDIQKFEDERKIEIIDYTDIEFKSGVMILDMFFGDNNKYPKGTIIFIDYIQMLSSQPDSTNSYRDIYNFINYSKECAVTGDFKIIVSSQLSRTVDSRTGCRPILSDYSGCSSLEEVPDHCLFLYRIDYYDPHDKPGLTEIIVAKSRGGNCGSISYLFDSKSGKFEEYEREGYISW